MQEKILGALTRRRFLTSSAAVAAGAIAGGHPLLARALQAQQSAPALGIVEQARATAATAKITTQKLRGRVQVLMGSGGNIAVLAGTEGKLLVDSGYSTSRPQLTEALTAISADPLKLLINTHWHFDHTDGNEWMHSAGASILAHEKTLARMSTPQFIVAFDAHLPASPAGALPTQTFAEKQNLKRNGENIRLEHYAAAHTDTDLSVMFTDSNVLHTGDTWFNGMYPFIDYSSGGNIDGMIAAAGKSLSIATASTIIIPGHGPVGNREQLSQFRDMLVGMREKVADLKKQGKSVEEVIAAAPNASYDAKFGTGFLKPEMFVRLVYQGV